MPIFALLMRCLYYILIWCWPVALWGQQLPPAYKAAPFLTHVARTGDDVPTVLEHYGLADFDCNVTRFFKINSLKDGDYRLKKGQTYKLPVKIAPFNGKNIRTSLGISDWATAKKIKDYNDALLAGKVREEAFEKDKKLWVPAHLLECDNKETTLPRTEIPSTTTTVVAHVKGGEPSAKGNSRNFPILGKNHAHTPLVSSSLKGKVYYLISGHGGPDPGARGKRAGITLCEDEYAYDVTLRLLKLLLSHGATAYMIVRDPNDGIRNDNFLKCDKDEEVWGDREIPVNQKARLGQRTDIINTLTEHHKKMGQNDQTVIEIHIDSRGVTTETDVFFYYRDGSEPSMDLALKMHQVFIDKYKAKRGPGKRYSGSVNARDLFTLRETHTRKAVYIELANIRNDWDQQRLVLSNNRQALANWIGEALLKR